MYVRVHDRKHNRYFNSEVFATINSGWYEKKLVKIPGDNDDCYIFIDGFDRNEKSDIYVINRILPDTGDDWIYINVERNSLLIDPISIEFMHNNGLYEYHGVNWLFDDKDTLKYLVQGNSISVKGSIFEDQATSFKLVDWNYIESQEDITFLMSNTVGFHDTILTTLNYESGGYVSENKSMQPMANKRIVTMKFDSQITDTIEMVFEAVTSLKLTTVQDNHSAEIHGASVFIDDGEIFFCDTIIKEIDTSFPRMWIKAYSLRWRFITNS